MKTNMKHLSIQLDAMPDEILMKIFMNLNNVQVFYSLMGINNRLDKIVCDPIFASRLSLMSVSSTGFIYPLNKLMLDRFRSQILPHIHHKIRSLNVESKSMKRILLAADYLELTDIGLYNIEVNMLESLLNDKTEIKRIFKNQISSLIITIRYNRDDRLIEDPIATICIHILTLFPNLRFLKFSDFSSNMIHRRFSFPLQLPSFSSSTLIELHINISKFDDCLHILDGRFNQLRRFYVNIAVIYPWIKVDNKKILHNLRCFSMTVVCELDSYDDLIVPFLHRMINIEELGLFFEARCDRFIDGNQLNKDILNRMPQLNKFSFNIRSTIYIHDQTSLPTNKNIQHTFIDFGNDQINCCADYFPKEGEGQCHIYSYPYTLKHYNGITNHFPGGLFKCVEEISLFDERPFEHEFFIKISQAFPFLKTLSVSNLEPQNNKRCSKLNDEDQNFNMVKYPCLIQLNLVNIHDDYVEQFLFDYKTCLPTNVSFSIYFNSLQSVTHNFTRDETRINCSKLKRLQIRYDICQHFNKIELPKHINDYFPNAEIS